MKAFYRFAESIDGERTARVGRGGRILASRAAREAAKKNPTLLWIDAAVSLLDAANAYFEFARESERLRALKRVTQTLDAELKSVLKRTSLDQKTWRNASHAQKAELERALEAHDALSRERDAKRSEGQVVLTTMRQALADLRETPDCSLERLENLQNAFDDFLAATIETRIALYNDMENDYE